MQFGINREYIDEVLLDVIPLDICEIMLRSTYLWDRDVLFYRNENKYRLIKDRFEYNISAHQNKIKNISLIIVG